MNLPQIHSITKKIFVALLGGFLVIFLLFHMCANLCILRQDGGEWYTAFCHFMGTNLIVKVFELILLGSLVLHIVLTLWLWFTNRLARPQRYHHASKTKTATGSKLAIWTGILILACLVLHFTDFYFVKLGIVDGLTLSNGEPDFYAIAHQKFANLYISIAYLVFFVIVWFHLRHAFASAFQTLGLYNHQYGKAIEVISVIYAWVVCVGFAAVPIGVLLGL